MIIEDKYGNLYEINEPSAYQAGGLVLPQYSGSQVTIQPPQNNLLNVPVNNNWDRYLQGEQLNMQRQSATQNTIDSIINNKIKQETQVRLNKQVDLTNKKLEWDMMKTTAKEIEDAIAMDADFTLPGDQAMWEQLLKDAKLDNESAANLSLDSFENAANFKQRKSALMYGQKQILNNKKQFTDTGKALTELDDTLKRGDALEKAGYLDEDDLNGLTTSANNIARKRLELANGTLKDWDISKDPDYLNISGYHSLIDEKEQKVIFDMQQQMNAAKMQEDLSTSQYNKAKADQLAALTPGMIAQTEMETEQMKQQLPGKLAVLAAQGKIDGAKAKILTDKIDAFYKQYPNPTLEDFAKLEGIIGKDAAKQYTSFENMAVDLLSKGEYDKLEQVYEAAAKLKQAEYIDKSTNSTVTHIKDANGQTIGIKQGDGGIDYGGRVVDKDGVTLVSVTAGGTKYITNNTGSAEEKGKVMGLPDGTDVRLIEMNGKGYLQIKGNNDPNRDWIYSKYGLPYGKTTFGDALDQLPGKPGVPAGAIFKGEYLYIPQDNVPLPAGGGTGGTGEFFNTPTAPAAAPGASKGKSGMG